jgi:hypothetical protein
LLSTLQNYFNVKTAFIYIFCIIICFLSACKKQTTIVQLDENGPLQVRIKNNSNNTFLYTAIANKTFGAVDIGGITSYKAFDQMVAYAGVNIVVNTDTVYAGQLYCGTPPLPMLEYGKYRLEISDNNQSPGFYNAIYVRE